jgi:hypothetical protein
MRPQYRDSHRSDYSAGANVQVREAPDEEDDDEDEPDNDDKDNEENEADEENDEGGYSV